MRILIFDEDTKHLPQLCDVLRQEGHEVTQVMDWKNLETEIAELAPEGIVIDLMIPPLDLPVSGCSAGYTTGVYVYMTFINKYAPGIPFVVFSGTELGLNFISKEVKKLESYAEFRGVLSKGCDEELIIEFLSKAQ